MKTLYKSILISLLAITANNAIASDYGIHSDEAIAEPRFQILLLPGVEKSARKSSVMHMVESTNHNKDLLQLNSSLTKPSNTISTVKHFDDIEVTDNNIFQLRF